MRRPLLLFFTLALLSGFAARAMGESSAGILTRADAIVLLVDARPETQASMRRFAAHMPPMPLFNDVDQGTWIAPYLEAAFDADLISGNTDRTFRPNAPLTTEQAITLAVRFRQAVSGSSPVVFTDPSPQTRPEEWYTTMINTAAAIGIRLPGSLQVGEAVTREQFLNVLAQVNVDQPPQVAFVPRQETAPAPAPASAGKGTPLLRPINLQPIVAQTVAPQSGENAVAADDQTLSAAQSAGVPKATPTAKAPPKKTYFAMSMPSLGINSLLISHPKDPFSHDGLLAPLKSGVGHLFSYPGKGGKILIYGHSSSYPWDVSPYTKIFRQINKLSIGDRVYINYGGTLYTYEVTSKESVPANDMSRYGGGGGEELILYTCWPPDSISQRYLVHAKPVATEIAQAK